MSEKHGGIVALKRPGYTHVGLAERCAVLSSSALHRGRDIARVLDTPAVQDVPDRKLSWRGVLHRHVRVTQRQESASRNMLYSMASSHLFAIYCMTASYKVFARCASTRRQNACSAGYSCLLHIKYACSLRQHGAHRFVTRPLTHHVFSGERFTVLCHGVATSDGRPTADV